MHPSLESVLDNLLNNTRLTLRLKPCLNPIFLVEEDRCSWKSFLAGFTLNHFFNSLNFSNSFSLASN